MADFKTPIPRFNTHSLKWERFQGKDILPFWVADMDFAAPAAVLKAIHQRLKHPVLGYGVVEKIHNESFIHYALRHYALTVDAESLVWLPGLVPALNVVARFVKGNVIIMPPVYPPFLKVAALQNKKEISVPLIPPSSKPKEQENAWAMDFKNLEIAFQNALPDSVLLLCHPHNPVGRMWKKEELERLSDLAKAYQITICSDEIHADLILKDEQHLPFVALDENAITLMSPSKTYNLPGLSCALAIIPNPHLRHRFLSAKAGLVSEPNILGMEAAREAFSACDDWKNELIQILKQNRDVVFRTLNAHSITQSHWVEATYLAWIDARAIPNALEYFESFGLGLSDGADFGAEGFLRLNFGTTPQELETALQRFTHAVEKL